MPKLTPQEQAEFERLTAEEALSRTEIRESQTSRLTPEERAEMARLANEEQIETTRGQSAPDVSPAQPPPVAADTDPQRAADTTAALLHQVPFAGGLLRNAPIFVGGVYDTVTGKEPKTWENFTHAVAERARGYKESDKRFERDNPTMATLAPFVAGAATAFVPLGALAKATGAGKTLNAAQRVGADITLGGLEDMSRGRDPAKGAPVTAAVSSGLAAIPYVGRALGAMGRRATGVSPEMADYLAKNRARVNDPGLDDTVAQLPTRLQDARKAVQAKVKAQSRAAGEELSQAGVRISPVDMGQRVDQLIGDIQGGSRPTPAGRQAGDRVKRLHEQLMAPIREAESIVAEADGQLAQIAAGKMSVTPQELADIKAARDFAAFEASGLDARYLQNFMKADINKAANETKAFANEAKRGGDNTDIDGLAIKQYRAILREKLEAWPPYSEKMDGTRASMDLLNRTKKVANTEGGVASSIKRGPVAGNTQNYKALQDLGREGNVNFEQPLQDVAARDYFSSTADHSRSLIRRGLGALIGGPFGYVMGDAVAAGGNRAFYKAVTDSVNSPKGVKYRAFLGQAAAGGRAGLLQAVRALAAEDPEFAADLQERYDSQGLSEGGQ